MPAAERLIRVEGAQFLAGAGGRVRAVEPDRGHERLLVRGCPAHKLEGAVHDDPLGGSLPVVAHQPAIRPEVTAVLGDAQAGLVERIPGRDIGHGGETRLVVAFPRRRVAFRGGDRPRSREGGIIRERSEVPFPEVPGGESLRSGEFRDRDLAGRELSGVHIDHAHAHAVTPGLHAGAGGGTDRSHRVEAVELHALRRHAVEMGSPHDAVFVEPDVAIAPRSSAMRKMTLGGFSSAAAAAIPRTAATKGRRGVGIFQRSREVTRRCPHPRRDSTSCFVASRRPGRQNTGAMMARRACSGVASRWWGPGGLALLLPAMAAAEVTVVPETVVSAERLVAGDVPLAAWDADEIARFSPRTIDELLANEPSFSLYRRQTSYFGNPTSAGVSLRRTGANAASRTLVLRDGIPQNDPFGGWVSWARYHPDLIGEVRIVPGAQAATWGNQSVAGSIHLTTRPATGNRRALRLTGGSGGTWGGSLLSESVSRDERRSAQIAVFTLQSDGIHGLPARQRGPIDRRLDLDSRGAEVRFTWESPAGLLVEPMISWYAEERGNGTPLARNSSEALDLSLRLTRDEPDRVWQATAYYQRRKFAARFSSVDAMRASETPALDQFDVPGEGIGGALTFALRPGEDLEWIIGADLRHLEGETNEDAGFVNGAFLRRRRAGGNQTFGGVVCAGGLASGTRSGNRCERAGRRVEPARRGARGAKPRDQCAPP